MTIELRNPEAPATNKQLWLLHVLTKTDTRNLNITMLEASKRIEALKTGKVKTEIKTESKPINQPEITIIQGIIPQGQTDMDKVKADFMLNAYPKGRIKVGNDTAKIDFYEHQCKDCLFGKTGLCYPEWQDAGFMNCGGKIESVSFSCAHYEPVIHSLSDYCHRPKGKQCHRKHIDNHCLECGYRKRAFRDGYNHTAWYQYIPTIQERINTHKYFIEQFSKSTSTEYDYKTAIEHHKFEISLLEKLLS
jgi:hypothetical protein